MRPTRLYVVRLGPAILPTEKGYEILTDVTEHNVMGVAIKHSQSPCGMGFLHILNNDGDIIFASPSTMILSIQAATGEYVPKTGELVPIHGRPANLQLVDPLEEEDDIA